MFIFRIIWLFTVVVSDLKGENHKSSTRQKPQVSWTFTQLQQKVIYGLRNYILEHFPKNGTPTELCRRSNGTCCSCSPPGGESRPIQGHQSKVKLDYEDGWRVLKKVQIKGNNGQNHYAITCGCFDVSSTIIFFLLVSRAKNLWIVVHPVPYKIGDPVKRPKANATSWNRTSDLPLSVRFHRKVINKVNSLNKTKLFASNGCVRLEVHLGISSPTVLPIVADWYGVCLESGKLNDLTSDRGIDYWMNNT